MSTTREKGWYSDGTNLIGRVPVTGGRVILEDAPFSYSEVKTHNGYTGSTSRRESGALTTADATVTPIASIAVPSGFAATVRAHILGVQSDDGDAITATAVGCAVNAAGTTALKGTPLYQIVESDAATNITITADDTTDTLRVNVIGVAAETWAWVCHYEWFTVNTSA